MSINISDNMEYYIDFPLKFIYIRKDFSWKPNV